MSLKIDLRLCTLGLAAAGAVLSAAGFVQGATGAKPEGQPAGATAVRDCVDACPEMVLIPPGEFVMGSPVTEPGREAPEGPQRKITISRSFLVGRYDVTVGQYAKFVAGTHHPNGDTCNEMPELDWRHPGFAQDASSPVVCVNYLDAQAYIGWLSRRTGHAYRLLSEAEYEYVNRAGTGGAYWWGSSIGADHANCVSCGSAWDGRRTSPVGSFAPNPFGLYDTTGDVYVWVADCWNTTLDRTPDNGSPNLGGDCTRRGLRGGGWGSSTAHLRAAFRLADPSGARHDNMGFRVARDR